MKKTVMITGANSGFGYLMAKTLNSNGYKVIGSMRDVHGRNASIAHELKTQGVSVIEIDVTSDVSVEKGVQEAINSVGTIDVLINNAGVGTLGWQESFDIDDFKRVFDINVFGVQRLTRALVPHMKANGQGTLIQVSSILGKFVLPFLGPYNATKHAVEGLAENYRVELSQFGIQSLIVQPGGFGTDFGANLMRPSDKEAVTSYGDHALAPEQMWAGTEQGHDADDAPSPQMVADSVLELLDTNAEDRPFRTVVDPSGLNPVIGKINEETEQAMQSIYSNYGMNELFKLNQS